MLTAFTSLFLFVCVVVIMIKTPTNELTHEQLLLSVNSYETEMAEELVNNSKPGSITNILDSNRSNIREEIGFYRVFDNTNPNNRIRRKVLLYDLERNPWRTFYFKGA
jgi:hypothetical protein